jgi:hypothetical protein
MSSEDKNMKPSEFYEQYWKIDYGNGKLVSPPKLSQAEKDFLDNAMETPNCQAAVFTRVRKRNVQVNVEALKREMNKFPQYFIPSQQPLLDEYGGILPEEDKTKSS